MSKSLGSEIMKFVNSCKSNKEVSREWAKTIALNILACRELGLEERLSIATAALKEYEPANPHGLLLEFVQEMQQIQA